MARHRRRHPLQQKPMVLPFCLTVGEFGPIGFPLKGQVLLTGPTWVRASMEPSSW